MNKLRLSHERLNAPLMERSGAKFLASVRKIEGEYAASYYVRSGYKTVPDEAPQTVCFASEADAHLWLRRQACARQFTRISWVRR
jgi:hypothetical protein